uniref:Uncharacterized protein n=2 Tax=Onchocerca ochengi TaxID=42157 RepID=A0A182EVY6_ONCOC
MIRNSFNISRITASATMLENPFKTVVLTKLADTEAFWNFYDSKISLKQASPYAISGWPWWWLLLLLLLLLLLILLTCCLLWCLQ